MSNASIFFHLLIGKLSARSKRRRRRKNRMRRQVAM